MANLFLKYPQWKHGTVLAKRLKNVYTYVENSRSKSTKLEKKSFECPQAESARRNQKDTKCEDFQKLMAKSTIESTCIYKESSCNLKDTTIDDECKLERILDPRIPKEVYEYENPCLPFDRDRKGCSFLNMCQIAELKRCQIKNVKRAHLCRAEKPLCLTWEKRYPMRHAGTKVKIDGRPKIGEIWKKQRWGINC